MSSVEIGNPRSGIRGLRSEINKRKYFVGTEGYMLLMRFQNNEFCARRTSNVQHQLWHQYLHLYGALTYYDVAYKEM